MEWTITPNEGTYILRYYLPCEPLCDEATSYRRMDELVEYCVKYGVGAAMLYVDLNPYWYYAPDSLEHTRYYVPIVKAAAEKLREKGISYQLNYQNLLGSWDGCANLQDVNPWEFYVDELGRESKSCACCAGEAFRRIAGEKMRLWAQTEPDVIWMDDDCRFHNHRTSMREVWGGKLGGERLDFGCFCDHHIAMFNALHGTAYTRDEIREGILDPSLPGDLRAKWLAFTGECARELMEWIETTIHAVSPETRVALMTSNPNVHSVEGREWGSFLKALSGEGRKPILRPTFGPYVEGNPRDFLTSYTSVQQLKTNIRNQYGKDVDFCPEIENTRFSKWSKSLGATGYQIMLSAFLGCKGVTLSIYDLDGCCLEEEPEFGQLLQARRAFIDNAAKLDLWDWEEDGICLMTHPDRIAGPENKIRVREINQLSRGRFWDETLLKAGIPCRYITPEELDGATGVALDRGTTNLLTDEELKKILSGGALLDAGALEVLEARGLGQYTGVRLGDRVHCIAASEILHTQLHRDGQPIQLPARNDGNRWHRLLCTGAEAVTTMITPEGEKCPGFTRFENELGGTVYVYAGNGSIGDGFYSTFRMKMLRKMCVELSGKKIFRLENAPYGLMATKHRDNEAAVFVANLNADMLEELVLEAPFAVKNVKVMDGNGQDLPVQVNGNRISCRVLLPIYGCVLCLFEKE